MKMHAQGFASLRERMAHISDAWVEVSPALELWLMDARIDPYTQGNIWNHEPERKRKLLAHAAEILKLNKAKEQKGLTIVPLKLYFVNGRAKVQLGLCRGKDAQDKRQTLIERTQKREMDRATKGR